MSVRVFYMKDLLYKYSTPISIGLLVGLLIIGIDSRHQQNHLQSHNNMTVVMCVILLLAAGGRGIQLGAAEHLTAKRTSLIGNPDAATIVDKHNRLLRLLVGLCYGSSLLVALIALKVYHLF
jgi:hypothetical protein